MPSSVDRPTYALHDPAAFAVNNELIAVCQASSCRSKGQAILQLAMSKQAHKFGLASAGPEKLMCRKCFKLEKRQYQRCGRCMGPPYCSIDCQKADWKRHKPDCNARVEAMQLSSAEPSQLDQDASDLTHATGELAHMNHPGKFPENQERLGLTSDLVGHRRDLEAVKQRARA